MKLNLTKLLIRTSLLSGECPHRRLRKGREEGALGSLLGTTATSPPCDTRGFQSEGSHSSCFLPPWPRISVLWLHGYIRNTMQREELKCLLGKSQTNEYFGWNPNQPSEKETPRSCRWCLNTSIECHFLSHPALFLY